MKRLILAAAAAAAVGGSAFAADSQMDFTYAPNGAQEYMWGTSKAEAYDVAIRISDPGMVGKKIVGVKVPMGSDESVTEISAWLSSELKLESKKNVADIASKAGEWKGSNENGSPYFEVTFDTPYTITEAGVYVGYSFKVGTTSTNGQKYPVIVAYDKNPNGFYLHSSRTFLKWVDNNANLGAVSYMKVILEGDFLTTAASVTGWSQAYVEKEKESTIAATVANHGAEAINTLGYTYTVDGVSTEGTVTLDTPIPAQYGAVGTVNFPVNIKAASGSYDMTLAITSINGKANEETATAYTGSVTVIPFMPVMRPLMEEYTGLWCGWCPRGFIAMERLAHLYGDRFVGLAFHNGDDMQFFGTYPSNVSGLPGAVLNRALEVDPYYGVGQTDMGITAAWEKLASVIPAADVAVTAEWTGASTLSATATVRFIEDSKDADYRIAFCLVGNNLSNARWKQSNYYAGDTSMEGDDWAVFCKGESTVTGLVYNDVPLVYDNFKGVSGSLPATIVAEQPITVEHSFDIATLANASGKTVAIDPSALSVVAIVTKGSAGTFVNCVESRTAGQNALTTITADSEEVAVEWYDLQGRRLSAPAPGLNIRTALHADGTRTTTKQLH